MPDTLGVHLGGCHPLSSLCQSALLTFQYTHLSPIFWMAGTLPNYFLHIVCGRVIWCQRVEDDSSDTLAWTNPFVINPHSSEERRWQRESIERQRAFERGWGQYRYMAVLSASMGVCGSLWAGLGASTNDPSMNFCSESPSAWATPCIWKPTDEMTCEQRQRERVSRRISENRDTG